MKNQNVKIFFEVMAGGILAIFLILPEMLISKLIYANSPEHYRFCVTVMIFITLLIYVIASIIRTVRYLNDFKKYKQEGLEKAHKELTKESKPVRLNYAGAISKDLFKCQARIDDDGKIACKIQLDYEVKLGSYEEFFNFFDFD